MEINKKITKVNRTVMSNKNNKYLVIHYVGAVSTAKNNADYFYSVDRGASAHYFVDDTSIWQVVEDKDAAWHVGTKGKYYHKYCRNNNSIGVEMCCIKKNGKLDISEQTVANTIELVKQLMAKYNIPVSHVVRHYDVTRKNCPAPFVKDTARWQDFKNRLVDAPATTYTAGQKVVLNNVPLYASSTTTKVSSYKTGTYYLWDAKVTNGRIRITNKTSNVGKSGAVTGWINTSSIRRK